MPNIKKIYPHTKQESASLTRDFKYSRSGVGVYLDYAATTPMDPLIKKAMMPYFSEKFGNPSSLHFFGQETLAAIDEAREKIAKTINADFREVIFTGSATEANNLALRGVAKNFGSYRAIVFQKQNNFAPAAKFSSPSARQSRFAGTKLAAPAGCSSKQLALNRNFLPLRIIVSAIEHESILETCRDLEREGVEIIYLPVNKHGIVDLKKLKESLNEQTILVSIMYANNEIGTIQPIADISKIINQFKEKNFSTYPLFHTDAVQAFQFLDCDVKKLGIDLMTLSAHKIYGPKGIGLLYVKSKVPNPKSQINSKYQIQNSKFLQPIITGGGQEFNLRSGTENVAAIAGFAKAIELAGKNREKESKKISALLNYFWHQLKKIYPKTELNGFLKITNLPNILNVYFPSQNAQDLLMEFDLNGVAISSGSACSARATKQSHVLKAIGLNAQKIKSSLRFSFGKFTTKKEINRALKIIKTII